MWFFARKGIEAGRQNNGPPSHTLPNDSFFNFLPHSHWICCRSDGDLTVIRMSVCSEKTHAVCLCLGIRTVATTGKERDATGQEEERIDDDLDFEPAKFTFTLRNLCRRPVTESDEEGKLSFSRPPARPSPNLFFICVTSRAACLSFMYPHSPPFFPSFLAMMPLRPLFWAICAVRPSPLFFHMWFSQRLKENTQPRTSLSREKMVMPHPPESGGHLYPDCLRTALEYQDTRIWNTLFMFL